MSCISETCRYAQCVKKWMGSAMYLSSYHDICDIYHQNSMTEINSFDIYSWHKQSVYDTCQEIILPTTWKKSPSGWMTPEIILLNDLKTPQKWSLAFPRPLNCKIVTAFSKFIMSWSNYIGHIGHFLRVISQFCKWKVAWHFPYVPFLEWNI